MSEAPDEQQMFEVRLLDMPLALRERVRQHGADTLREMTLIVTGTTTGEVHDVPRRLLELADEVQKLLGPFIVGTTDEMDAAFDRGEPTIREVVYRLPTTSIAFLQRLLDSLAEVESYCQAGEHLLTLAAPPDVLAYREWSITEMQRQYAGLPPLSWPDYARDRGL
jgi:hypothetical protein